MLLNKIVSKRILSIQSKKFLNKISKSININKIRFNNIFVYSCKSFCSKKTDSNNIFQGENADNLKNGAEKEYYTPSETLVFKEKKLMIVKAEQMQKKLVQNFTYILMGLNTIFGYKCLANLYYWHPVYAIIWSVPFIFCLRLSSGLKGNKLLIINSISLYDDGENLEVEVMNHSFKTKIGEIRITTADEAKDMLKHLSVNIFQEYFPVIIGKNAYLLPRKLEINNKEILGAVMKGQYINLQGETGIKDDNTIDIN